MKALTCFWLLLIPALGIAAPNPKPPTNENLDRYGDPLPTDALARIGTSRYRLGNQMNAVSLSGDGKLIAVGGYNDGTIHLWDARTGREVRQIEFPEMRGTNHLKFSPDGKKIFSIGTDSQPRCFDTETGKVLWTTKQRGYGQLTAWSADGKRLAFVSSDTATHILSGETGEEESSFSNGNRMQVTSILFRPGTNEFLSYSADNMLRIYDLAKKSEVKSIQQTLDPMNRYLGTTSFSADGKTLAINSAEGIKIWSWEANTIRLLKRDNPLGTRVLAMSPDGRFVAATFNDNSLGIFGIASGKELRYVRSSVPANYMNFAFSEDSSLLMAMSMNYERSLKVWDLAENKPLHPDESVVPTMSSIWINGGKTLVTMGTDGIVRAWNPETGEKLHQLGDPCNSVSILPTPDGKGIRALLQAQYAWVEWVPGQPSKITPIKGTRPNGMIRLMPPGGERLLVHIYGQNSTIIDPATEKVLVAFPENTRPQEPFNISNDGRKILAQIMNQNQLMLWDVDTNKAMPHLPIMGYLSALSGDGRLAVGMSTPNINNGQMVLGVVETSTAQEISRISFMVQNDYLRLVRFAPDNRTLVLTFNSGKVSSFDILTGKEIASAAGIHRGSVMSLSWSPDGQRMVTASDDGTILIWKASRFAVPAEKARVPSGEEVNRLWDSLLRTDAKVAMQAIRTLVDAGPTMVPLLHEYMKKREPIPNTKILELIVKLDSNRFREREQAARELGQLGSEIVPHLKVAIEKSISEDARSRMAGLLSRYEGGLGGEQVRTSRLIEVLEHIGSPEAAAILEELGKGDPLVVVVREARSSLKRLQEAKLASGK